MVFRTCLLYTFIGSKCRQVHFDRSPSRLYTYRGPSYTLSTLVYCHVAHALVSGLSYSQHLQLGDCVAGDTAQKGSVPATLYTGEDQL